MIFCDFIFSGWGCSWLFGFAQRKTDVATTEDCTTLTPTTQSDSGNSNRRSSGETYRGNSLHEKSKDRCSIRHRWEGQNFLYGNWQIEFSEYLLETKKLVFFGLNMGYRWKIEYIHIQFHLTLTYIGIRRSVKGKYWDFSRVFQMVPLRIHITRYALSYWLCQPSRFCQSKSCLHTDHHHIRVGWNRGWVHYYLLKIILNRFRYIFNNIFNC